MKTAFELIMAGFEDAIAYAQSGGRYGGQVAKGSAQPQPTEHGVHEQAEPMGDESRSCPAPSKR